MKRLAVGLLVVGLLAVAGPASAGHTFATSLGMADPLGLIASGAIVPFFSTGGDVSVLEIASPVGDNSGATPTHLVFFNSSCTRDVSVNLPLTRNDVAVPVLNDFVDPDFNGLVAIGGTLSGIDLVALQNPIHVRVHRFNFTTGQDYARVYDPIGALNAEERASNFVGATVITNGSGVPAGLPADLIGDPVGSRHTWNPSRSGATFAVPVLDGTFLNATLDFVCPTSSVFAAWAFPPAPANFFQNIPLLVFAPSAVQGVIFDDDENFLRDISTDCSCLTSTDVRTLNIIYSDATATTSVFYTELASSPADTGFVAYRTLRATFDSRAVDDFGRLPNANRTSLGPGVPLGVVTGAR